MRVAAAAAHVVAHGNGRANARRPPSRSTTTIAEREPREHVAPGEEGERAGAVVVGEARHHRHRPEQRAGHQHEGDALGGLVLRRGGALPLHPAGMMTSRGGPAVRSSCGSATKEPPCPPRSTPPRPPPSATPSAGSTPRPPPRSATTRRAPGYGHPAYEDVGDERAPCRVCLGHIEPGEARLLVTHDPFAAHGTYPLPGPIFVHARACAPFDGPGLPPVLRAGRPHAAGVRPAPPARRGGARRGRRLGRAGLRVAARRPRRRVPARPQHERRLLARAGRANRVGRRSTRWPGVGRQHLLESMPRSC